MNFVWNFSNTTEFLFSHDQPPFFGLALLCVIVALWVVVPFLRTVYYRWLLRKQTKERLAEFDKKRDTKKSR